MRATLGRSQRWRLALRGRHRTFSIAYGSGVARSLPVSCCGREFSTRTRLRRDPARNDTSVCGEVTGTCLGILNDTSTVGRGPRRVSARSRRPPTRNAGTHHIGRVDSLSGSTPTFSMHRSRRRVTRFLVSVSLLDTDPALPGAGLEMTWWVRVEVAGAFRPRLRRIGGGFGHHARSIGVSGVTCCVWSPSATVIGVAASVPVLT